MHNSKNIKVSKVILDPSRGEHNILSNQFIWRTKKEFVGENEVGNYSSP